MTGLVVDASVAIKWVIEEEGTSAALALRGQKLAAPDLINAECANILWKKARLGELSADEAAFAARLLASGDIEMIQTRDLAEAAVLIAIELDHPAYDCLYLAVAERLDTELVTADNKLLRKAGATDRFRRLVRGL